MSHLAIDTLLKVRSLSPRADTISIGGGFPTSSVEYGVWRNLQSRLKNEMFIDSDKPKDQYPFGSPLSGQYSLRFIANQHRPLTRRDMESTRRSSDSMAQRAHRHNIKILAEPGRSLCQFAGASFFPVLSCHALPNAARTVTVVRGTRACLLIVGLCSSMIEVCHNGLDLRSSRMHSGSELNHFCQRMRAVKAARLVIAAAL